MTTLVPDANDFRPTAGSGYIYSVGVEQRAQHATPWLSRAGVVVVRIDREEQHSIAVDVNGTPVEVPLRSERSLAAVLAGCGVSHFYLDITGLRHPTWMALLKSALAARYTVDVVYVEPEEYQPSLTPTESELFDLSERIMGIAALPGFATFPRLRDDFVFVPMLGFEGARASFVSEHVQPKVERIAPIIGVPGFRPEYPFSTYLGNRAFLRETESWKAVHFADANCPFAAFHALQEIRQAAGDIHMKIAPIGTKPHALGAAMFSLLAPARREMVYDHPIRKGARTIGAARALVYHISHFLDGSH